MTGMAVKTGLDKYSTYMRLWVCLL